MPDKFHNPYNFVPTMDPAPAGQYAIDANGQPQNMLGQGRPAGHDRYVPGLWSGRIGIEIVAMTPLLIPEAKPVREVTQDGPAKGHKVYRTRRGPDGQTPLLPVTSLKGPLRVAYEAVTNSRLAVFKGHEELLARRMSPKEALQLVPGRIVTSRTGSDLEVELLLGTTTSGYPRWDAHRQEWTLPHGTAAYAAWLPCWRAAPVQNFGLPSGLAHGAPVSIRLQKVERGPITLWQVVRLAPGHNASGGFVDVVSVASGQYQPQAGAADFHPASTGETNGYLCLNERNFGRKHDERVFFGTGSTRLPLSQTVKDQWRRLILNYKATYSSHGWNFPTTPSRHLTQANSEKLVAGTLCYVKLQRDDSKPGRPLVMDLSGRIPIVGALYPVCVSRELELATPEELLGTGLRPAQSLDRLSPADRVFGWVRDEQQGRTANGVATPSRPAAYKGQLRIAPIEYVECRSKGQDGKPLLPIATFGDAELPLAILATPKPEQTRFYLGKRDPQGRVQPLPNGIGRREAAYARDKVLRGRKVYPHQAAMAGLKDYWQPSAALNDARSAVPEKLGSPQDPRYREYVRRPQRNNTPQQDSQNRSISDWVRPSAVFQTHIDVTNLNKAELGALLWLLDLSHFSEDGEDEPRHFHRIGGGKSLGFGSVLIRLVALDVSDGRAKAIRYGSLLRARENEIAPEHIAAGANSKDARSASKKFVQAFRTAVSTTYNGGQGFDEAPFIEAFLAAARGHTENLPTHYPRTKHFPDGKGENYKWFVANEKEGGHPRGRKLSLGSLGSDPSLPYEPTE